MANATSDSLARTIIEHAHTELHAWSAYLAAYFWFDKEGFDGFAKWAKHESEEERSHAMHLIEFMLARKAGAVEFRGLPAIPQERFDSVVGILELLYQKERDTTASINAAFATARAEGDFAVEGALAPMVKEQVEAEDEMEKLVQRAKEMAATPGLLRVLDHQMSHSS